ncbi:MAG: NAD(+)/NADH kinase [Gemmataceae bacterium]
MPRIMVLGNAHRPGVPEEAELLLPFLREHADVVHVDLVQESDLAGIDADLTVVLGGDGAILRAARQMGYHQRPVLGINLGRLGFLADLTPEEFRGRFDRILAGGYHVTRHLMFEASYELPGEPPHTRRPSLGLNDVTVHTGPPFHMLELDLLVHGELAARYSGDGLIVSTPVGSTAHSLSAGGPIVGQELPAFVLTPICAHGLTSRPLVDTADQEYTIAVRRATSVMLVLDGQEVIPLQAGAVVRVRRAPVSFMLARVAGRSYYRTLHDKLFWGVLPSYRVEPSRPPERSGD